MKSRGLDITQEALSENLTEENSHADELAIPHDNEWSSLEESYEDLEDLKIIEERKNSAEIEVDIEDL
jgi:hypothetical protein